MNTKLLASVHRLRKYNEWRRGGEFELGSSPTQIGKDLDAVLNWCLKNSSTTGSIYNRHNSKAADDGVCYEKQ
jgi:hypothetical protein